MTFPETSPPAPAAAPRQHYPNHVSPFALFLHSPSPSAVEGVFTPSKGFSRITVQWLCFYILVGVVVSYQHFVLRRGAAALLNKLLCLPFSLVLGLSSP